MPVLIRQADRVSDVNTQRKGGSLDEDVIYLGSVTRRHAHPDPSCVFPSTISDAAGKRSTYQNTNARARSSNHIAAAQSTPLKEVQDRPLPGLVRNQERHIDGARSLLT